MTELNHSKKSIEKLIEQVELMLEVVANIEKVARPSLEREHYYSDSELSELLRISRRTLIEWRKKGIISYIILEGKILYKSTDILQLLEKNYYKAFK